MKEIILSGGTVLYLIIITSVVALGFIIERLLAFSRASTRMEDFFPEVEGKLRLGKLDEARQLCADEPGLIPELMTVGLDNRDEGIEVVKQLLADEVQVTALPTLEKHLSVIAVIARVAPMLGLLGTVIGMMIMFQEIKANPNFDVSTISGGIFQAMGTTAAGLMVAIPLIFCHAYFTSRVERFEVDAYKYLTRMVRLMSRRAEVGARG